MGRLRSRSRLSEDLTFFISSLASALTFQSAGGLLQPPAGIISCLLRKEEPEDSSVVQQWPGPSTPRQALIPAIS